MSVTLSGQRARVERIEIEHAGLAGVRAWRVGNRVGESPTWNSQTQELIWIDVRAPAVLRLDPRTDTVTRWQLPEVVGALGLAGANRVVLALRRCLATLDLSTGLLRPLLTVHAEPPGNRLNDAKVSASGRWLVFGSMDDRADAKQRTGALYCAGASAGTDATVRRIWQGLTVANGIAWSPDGAILYFSDSHAGQVWHTPWDEATGTMGEPQRFCSADERLGRPDGAATDAAGDYWSAGVSAGCLNRFAPDGRHLQSLPLPCRAPTMPCFGGENLDTLFVTSLVRPQWCLNAVDLDGSLLALPVQARGRSSTAWATVE